MKARIASAWANRRELTGVIRDPKMPVKLKGLRGKDTSKIYHNTCSFIWQQSVASAWAAQERVARHEDDNTELDVRCHTAQPRQQLTHSRQPSCLMYHFITEKFQECLLLWFFIGTFNREQCLARPWHHRLDMAEGQIPREAGLMSSIKYTYQLSHNQGYRRPRKVEKKTQQRGPGLQGV